MLFSQVCSPPILTLHLEKRNQEHKHWNGLMLENQVY